MTAGKGQHHHRAAFRHAALEVLRPLALVLIPLLTLLAASAELGPVAAALTAGSALLLLCLALYLSQRELADLRNQNAAHANELQRRALQLETLITTGGDINTLLDVEILLDYIVNGLQVRFGYDFIGIFLLDESGDAVVARAGTGEIGAQLVAQGYGFKVGEQGLIGWVAEQRRGLCVNDVQQDPRYVAHAILPGIRSELTLPLQVGETFLGVLDIQSRQVNAFDVDDERVFRVLAQQIATALENVARYQGERSRRLLAEKLYEVGRALSRTLDLREVLSLILDDLGQILDFDRGSVLLERGEQMEMVAACGFPPESNPRKIRISIKQDDVFRKIYHTGEPLAIDDVLGRPDWQQVEGLPQARAWVGVPLINAEDQVIGMLSLAREHPTPFSSDEVELATTFAGQAAIALQNARLYSQLAYAYAQLERLDQAKSDFITVASHELRTPLALIRGFSEILEEEPGIQANVTYLQIVQGICDGALRLQKIVDRMVSMAEIDTQLLQLHMETLALAPLLQCIEAEFAAPLHERRLTLVLNSLDTLPPIEADAAALRKVFTHLLMNAIKYTPDGGVITVTGQVREPGYRKMPQHSLELLIQDEGIGIPQEAREQIFTKFYHTGDVALHSSGTTKFKGGGPGLGLAITRGIVEAHHGQVWVESPGYDEQTCPGSRFYVLLPLHQELAPAG